MKRLTKTFRNGEVHTLRTCCAPYYKKLSQYEDIEEELGIELATLFKALKQGFYHKDDFGYIEFISGYMIKMLNKDKYEELRKTLKDYGKTWALTKEELL